MLSEGSEGERGNRDQNTLYLKIPVFQFFKKSIRDKDKLSFVEKLITILPQFTESEGRVSVI